VDLMPISDAVYFIIRLVVSASVLLAAQSSLRVARRQYDLGRPWHIAATGAALLLTAGALSTFDAIDNILLRPTDPIHPKDWWWLLLFDTLVPIWAFLVITAWRERDRALTELLRLSATDQLTGALNRRGFLERAASSIAQGRRSGVHPSVIMMDLDHFKAINDTYGHAAGDEVLRNSVAVLLATMRHGDLLGRVGGEEFAVLLHDATADAAASIADRLRLQVRSNVQHPGGAGNSVTISGGVAPVSGAFEPEVALSVALTKADEALYQAKCAGRDRIVLAAANEATPDLPSAPGAPWPALTTDQAENPRQAGSRGE
jgi:diguanylate cyclase (GGDEF)-like protein